MSKVELQGAEALLDIGVSVPLLPLRLRKWKIFTPRLKMKRPPLGGLVRIIRQYLLLEVELNKEIDDTEALKLMATKGKEVAKIVALMICSGRVSGRLVAPILAKILLWRTHPNVLYRAMEQYIELIDKQAFTNIIRSVSEMNLLRPHLSQKGKRS